MAAVAVEAFHLEASKEFFLNFSFLNLKNARKSSTVPGAAAGARLAGAGACASTRAAALGRLPHYSSES